jgi:hypothetical protein
MKPLPIIIGCIQDHRAGLAVGTIMATALPQIVQLLAQRLNQ